MNLLSPLQKSVHDRRRLVLLVVIGSSCLLFGSWRAWPMLAAPTPQTPCGPGTLDPSFNGTGIVTTPVSGGGSGSTAIQADGKIVVAGSAFNSSNANAFAVVRYNSDGSLDTSFNGTGKVITTIGSVSDVAAAVAIQQDGKIVVAGSSTVVLNNVGNIAVVRYNSNGSLDTSFNGTGKVTTLVGETVQGSAVAIQTDGKIVVAGSHSRPTSESVVVRYNTNGSLDTSFNGTGTATVDIGDAGRTNIARSVAIQTDGKIVVASRVGILTPFSLAWGIARFNANGSLDTSFNGTGKMATSMGGWVDDVGSVLIQSDGKIVVGGFAGFRGPGTSVMPFTAVARYNNNGSLDTSFNGTGKAITTGAESQGNAAALQQDGKIVVAGTELFRFNSNGSLDTSFGGTGRVPAPIFETSVALQTDGKIVAAGNSNSGSDSSVARHLVTCAAAAPTVSFTNASYNTPEDVTFVTITVSRTGDTSGASTVDYATADGTATERKDYTTALGTLRFAPGETSKTIDLLISEDSFTEGLETFTLALSNPVGATLGATSVATVQINDDVTEPATNAIDDANNFVGQHYHDFLNRQADTPGFNFWTGIIAACGSTASCIDQKRSSVSAAFFLAIEFQQTGFQVIRMYKATFTDSPARPRGFPRYREFLRDEQEISRGVIVGQGNWTQQLSANTLNLARAWVQKPEVLAVLPDTGAIPDQYVDKLFANSEVTPTASERSAAITSFGAGGVDGRAQALLSVTASGSVVNKQYNAAFVLMQYLGYLRRNPNDAPDSDYTGFDFWLNKLNAFSSAGEDMRDSQSAERRVLRAQMVTAFIVSIEYRQRFGP